MATYYVSAQNGSDSNDGTSVGAVKASFSAGIALLSSAGDKLYIGPGYYPESSTINMVGDGNLTNPIQIIGDPEAQFLTSDNPGEIVVAGRDADGGDVNTVLMNFSSDDHFYVKNITLLSGNKGTSAKAVNCSNSDGMYFENCLFQGGYYSILGDQTEDVTLYNCVGIGGRTAIFQYCNLINCVAIGGFYPIYRCYSYGCMTIGGFYANNDCYSDGYGSTTSDYGAQYNNLAISGYYNYRNPAGNNLISYGSAGEGFFYGNHYVIGAYSLYDFKAHNDAHTQNAGVFPLVNSGSDRSTAYYQTSNATYVNDSPDSADFVVTETKGATYIGYTGMARDLAHIFRLRVPEQSSFDLLPTGSTGENFFSTKITGSDFLSVRLEALQAFVSGAGLRYAANALKDTYTPPAERDLIGTPLQGLSTQSGYLDYERTKGGYPGPYFNGRHNLEFGSSFISSSDHAIKLTDYGSYNIGSYAHNSITASVGVKYNAGTPPEIRIVNQNTGHPLVSQAASGTGDQTSAYQHLSVQTTASGHVDIVLHSPHPPQSAPTDEVHQGSGAIVYFADLKINEG